MSQVISNFFQGGMIWWFRILSAAGFMASIYALIVRYKVLQSKSYTPSCDISDRISCSKAFGSDYSKTMGVPNPMAGLIYYSGLIAASSIAALLPYLFYLTLPALGFTVYLAFVSYVRQKNFCLVCSFVYAVNILLAWLAF